MSKKRKKGRSHHKKSFGSGSPLRKSHMMKSQEKIQKQMHEISQWNTDMVCHWVSTVSHSEFYNHVDKFREQGIDGRQLLKMTKRELKNSGLNPKERDSFFRAISSIHVSQAECHVKQVPFRNNVSEGDLITLLDNRVGHVRYIGNVKGKTGQFLGIDLMNGEGKNDGTFNRVRYFDTKDGNHSGIFVRRKQILQMGAPMPPPKVKGRRISTVVKESFSGSLTDLHLLREKELIDIIEGKSTDFCNIATGFASSEMLLTSDNESTYEETEDSQFSHDKTESELVGAFTLDFNLKEAKPVRILNSDGSSRRTKTWLETDPTLDIVHKYINNTEDTFDEDLVHELEEDPILWSLSRQRRAQIDSPKAVVEALNEIQRALNLITKFIPDITDLMGENKIAEKNNNNNETIAENKYNETKVYKTNIIQELLKRVQKEHKSKKILKNFSTAKKIDIEDQELYNEEDLKKMVELMAWVRNNVTAATLTDENDANTVVMGLEEVKTVLIEVLEKHMERRNEKLDPINEMMLNHDNKQSITHLFQVTN